jgi:hypothetical protein
LGGTGVWIQGLALKASAPPLEPHLEPMLELFLTLVLQVLNSVGAYRLSYSFPEVICHSWWNFFPQWLVDFHSWADTLVEEAMCVRKAVQAAPSSLCTVQCLFSVWPQA